MKTTKSNTANKLIIYPAIAILIVLSCVFLVGIIDNHRNIRAIEESQTESSQEETQNPSSTAENTSEEETETEIKTTEATSKSEPTTSGGSQATGDKTVYLTFDDGPSHVTDRVLDILDRYNVKATFFVINTKNSDDRLREIHKRGHAIGLHSYTHNYNEVYSSTDAFFEDLQKISNRVENVVGIKPKITRFPGGSSNEVSKKISPGIMTKLTNMLQDKGYTYFDWNCENGDGNGNNISADKLLAQVKATAPKGAKNVCVLMHDSSEKSTTADSLPKVIEYFRDQGYTFKVLTENSHSFKHTVKN